MIEFIAALLASVIIEAGTYSGGTYSGDTSTIATDNWVYLEDGSAPGAVAVGAPAGDFLPPHLVVVSPRTGVVTYSVTVSSISACPVSDWIAASASGTVTAGTPEHHPITFLGSNDCAPGTYTATVTFSAPGRIDQVFNVTATVAAAEPAGSFTMAVFGDSISANGTSTTTDWSALLPTRYGASLTNHAVPGDICSDLAVIVDAEIISGIPAASIGVIQCGTNDSSSGVSLATFTSEVQGMVDALQADGHTFLLLLGPPYRYPPASFAGCGSGSESACRTIIDDYNTAMDTIATTEGLGFVSMRDTMGDIGTHDIQRLCFDTAGVHPGSSPAASECADRIGIDVALELETVRPAVGNMAWGIDPWGTKPWGT